MHQLECSNVLECRDISQLSSVDVHGSLDST